MCIASRWICLPIAVALACCAPTEAVAQKLDGLRPVPTGGRRGTEVAVALPGKFESWPIEIWSESPSVRWTASETSGTVIAHIAPDAPLGMHRIRFANAGSASSLLPWIVSDQTETIEAEPNDDYRSPQTLPSIDINVSGVLAKSGDTDHYALAVAKGQQMTISIDAQRSLRSPMDACLQVLDTRGNVLAQNLDAFGLDPRIHLRVPDDGRIVIRVFAFPETPDSTIGYAGGERFAYRLQVRDGFVEEMESVLRDGAQPMGEPSDRNQPIQISEPGAWYGAVETSRDEDVLAIETQQPGPWTARLRAREFGSPLDGVLELLNGENASIAKQGDSGEIRDPVLSNIMKEPGRYRIAVRDLHGNFGATLGYRLELQQERPSLRGTVPNDVLTGSVGQPIAIDVAIERTLECADAASIQVVGLPEGFTSAAVTSESGQPSANKVSLSIVAPRACSIPIQIRIVRGAADGSTTSYAKAVNADAPYLWLVVP